MSKVEQLIKEFCPEGVKNGQLIDMLEQPITDGPHETPVFVENGIPFLSAEAIVDNKINFNNKRGYITEEYDSICAKKYKPRRNDVFLVKSGSTVGKVAIVDFEANFNIWSPLASMRVNEHNNAFFLYYLLQTRKIQEQIRTKCSLGSQPNLSMRTLEKFDVPLPPLEVQQSIVDVLDKFEAIRNNLNAELALRRKQYEHYREKLLTFGDDVERVKVCDFCELRAGKSINASELSDDNEYWCYGGNGTRGKVNFYSHSGEYAIIGRQGALCGCVSWATGNFYATEHAVVVTPKKNVNSRFLFHLFTFSNLNQYKSQGAQPGLAVSKLNELIFQIPNYATQQSIVSKLDKFEALISNIERELELRTKQYEYYREKLLTF